MVYRVFVEKKPELAFESEALLQELCLYAGLHSLKSLRVVNRYDAEGLTGEDFEIGRASCRERVYDDV